MEKSKGEGIVKIVMNVLLVLAGFGGFMWMIHDFRLISAILVGVVAIILCAINKKN